jgi:hypothetical protein
VFAGGPNTHLLPDIAARPAHRRIPDRLTMKDGTVVSVPWRGWRDGDHRPDGFYLRAGAGVQPGPGPEVGGIDFAEFLCSPLGMPITAART